MSKYRKKPVEIEAMQLTGTSAEMHDVYLWIENHIGSVDPEGTEPGVTIDPADGKLTIKTLEGNMKADVGDYVIRGVQGEFYPCKPDIFDATYDDVREGQDSINFDATATAQDGVTIPMSVKVEFPKGYGLYAVKMIEKLPDYRNDFYQELINGGDASIVAALLEAQEGDDDE